MWKVAAILVYLIGAVITFLVVGFGCVLGGKEEDLWKPFVCALTWPISLPVIGVFVLLRL